MTAPIAGNPGNEDYASSTLIVIGLGNRFRQDDAAGLVVAQRIRKVAPPTVRVVEHDGDPLDLLPIWSGHNMAILVDALSEPGEAGEIRCFDPGVDLSPNREVIVSSHGHSLWDALELARIVRQRPRRALIFAISGKRFDYGEELSPEVARAVDTVVSRILNALSQYE